MSIDYPYSPLLRRYWRFLQRGLVCLVIGAVVVSWGRGAFADQPPQGVQNLEARQMNLYTAMATSLQNQMEAREAKLARIWSRGTPLDRKALAKMAQEGLPTPSSLEKQGQEVDLASAWNLLDMGIGLFQHRNLMSATAKSAALKEKTAHTLAKEIRGAYWRSATADLLLPTLDPLLEQARTTLLRLRDENSPLNPSSTESMLNQKHLLESIENLWEWRKKLTESREVLSALTGQAPGDNIQVFASANELLDPGMITLPLLFLENHALRQRGELEPWNGGEWIGAEVTGQALQDAFPTLERMANGPSASENKSEPEIWQNIGSELAWNLVKGGTILRGSFAQRHEKNPKRVSQLALGLAVITQLHLTIQSYRQAETALADIRSQNRHHHESLSGKDQQEVSEANGLVEAAQGLEWRIRQGFAFATMQEALGRFLTSIGVDFLPPISELQSLSLPVLAANIGFRHEGITTSLLSEMNAQVAPDRSKPSSPSFTKKGGPSLEAGLDNFWNTMDQTSRSIVPQTPTPPPPPPPSEEFSSPEDVAPPEGEMVPISSD